MVYGAWLSAQPHAAEEIKEIENKLKKIYWFNRKRKKYSNVARSYRDRLQPLSAA